MTNRRSFLKQSAVLSSTIALSPILKCTASTPKAYQPTYRVFSKHLQFLDYKDMADAAAEIGFDGIDLTVRKGGHVLPENVKTDLPKAVEAIKAAGLKADMMATNVNNAEDEIHRQVLETAAKEGVKIYRLGYVSFDEKQSIPDRLRTLNQQMKRLADYNKKLGITGTYQNHAGKRVGAAIWDIHHLLEGIDADALGCQYDIRHATVEGGTAWNRGLELIRPKINCIVLKDFLWKKIDGKWKVYNVPLGEGMVDFDAYFKLLKSYSIEVPISLHYEYDLGGAEHGKRDLSSSQQAQVFKAMKRDLDFAKAKWEEVWNG